jgi:hypothetical protein
MKVPTVISVSFPLHGMFTQSPECWKRHELVAVLAALVFVFVEEVLVSDFAFTLLAFAVVVDPEWVASKAIGFAPTCPRRTGQSRM